jgi:hypothetical protein
VFKGHHRNIVFVNNEGVPLKSHAFDLSTRDNIKAPIDEPPFNCHRHHHHYHVDGWLVHA